MREAIETLRKGGRTIVLATHNLDEADRLCDRIAFVRGGLLRVDSPARLRGALGARGLAIRLAGPASDALLGTVRAVPGVGVVQSVDGTVRVGVEEPEAVAPAVVRAVVAAGGDVVEVRVERTSLEQIYFDVMGIRPAGDEDVP